MIFDFIFSCSFNSLFYMSLTHEYVISGEYTCCCYVLNEVFVCMEWL